MLSANRNIGQVLVIEVAAVDSDRGSPRTKRLLAGYFLRWLSAQGRKSTLFGAAAGRPSRERHRELSGWERGSLLRARGGCYMADDVEFRVGGAEQGQSRDDGEETHGWRVGLACWANHGCRYLCNGDIEGDGPWHWGPGYIWRRYNTLLLMAAAKYSVNEIRR